ncbi:MAG: aldo/keto reductase [Bacteroidota bacterium]
MSITIDSKRINRREFLQTGGKAAAAVVFADAGKTGILSALTADQNTNGIPTVTLNNGVTMPMLGLGTMTLDGPRGANCVSDAISFGYRLLDTATIYGNEEFVGAGIQQTGIKREELFVTTKLWVSDAGYESAKNAFERSLNKLKMEYVDLYLIHRPRGDYKGSWKAMEELYKKGRIKAIGVSNFEPHQIEELTVNGGMKPAVNQIETHAFFQEFKAQTVLKNKGIQMEAWSPFAEGRNGMFNNPTLAKVGAKYKKSNAQVSLRWLHQRGIVAIPRSSQKAHLKENLEIFDFVLDDSDMKNLASLDLNTTQFPEWG